MDGLKTWDEVATKEQKEWLKKLSPKSQRIMKRFMYLDNHYTWEGCDKPVRLTTPPNSKVTIYGAM